MYNSDNAQWWEEVLRQHNTFWNKLKKAAWPTMGGHSVKNSILREKLLKAQRKGIFTMEEINAIEDYVVFHHHDRVATTYLERTIQELLRVPACIAKPCGNSATTMTGTTRTVTTTEHTARAEKSLTGCKNYS